MSAAHTPGPWQYKAWYATDGYSEIVAHGWEITAGGYLLPLCAQTGEAEEAEANARLIAAAPDLFAALEACEMRLTHLAQDGASVAYELKKARAALALAWGEA